MIELGTLVVGKAEILTTRPTTPVLLSAGMVGIWASMVGIWASMVGIWAGMVGIWAGMVGTVGKISASRPQGPQFNPGFAEI